MLQRYPPNQFDRKSHDYPKWAFFITLLRRAAASKPALQRRHATKVAHKSGAPRPLVV